MEQSDSELLERWGAGDKQAGEAIFDRYYQLVERFFINKVGTDIEDLIQETFTACVVGRDRLRNTASFRSYLFSVAHNVLRGQLRKKYRAADNIDFDAVSIVDLSPGPSSIVGHRREHRLLLEGLRNIPVAYQVLLELHYWEQSTTSEMAEILEIPLGTCRSRLKKARELLNAAMNHLEKSPDRLATTETQLDDWAAECRRQMDR